VVAAAGQLAGQPLDVNGQATDVGAITGYNAKNAHDFLIRFLVSDAELFFQGF